jgi:hypothetical protein
MIRRGVPQKTAREISGNMVSEADIRDAARKIEQGAKAVIHSSFTVDRTEDETQQKGDARKPEESIS